MTWQFELLNDNLGRVFDTDHPVLSLVAKGSVAPDAPGNPPAFYSVSVESPGWPVLALRATNCHAGPEYTTKSGSTVTFHFYAMHREAGALVEWYIYDTPPTTPKASGWVMELLNEDGEVIVSSDYPPMKIIDQRALGGSGLDPAKKYALYVSSSGWRHFAEVELPTFGGPIITEYWFRRCWRWTGASYSYDEFPTNMPAANSWNDSFFDPPFVTVIDVTHH